MSPGEKKEVNSPALHDVSQPVTASELDKEAKESMSVTAYGCKKDAYDWATDESATLSLQTIVFDRHQTLTFH